MFVEHLDAVPVFVDESQIVELLKQEVARVAENFAARVITSLLLRSSPNAARLRACVLMKVIAFGVGSSVFRRYYRSRLSFKNNCEVDFGIE